MGDAARQDRNGRELAGYRLVRLLAQGGMAEVFLATRAGELYALKRILPEHADSPARVARFVDEMQLAVTLDHPNVVQAFDFGEEEGTYWLLLELVHGVDLRKLVEGLREHAIRHGERYPGQRAGILPPELVARIGLQIAHGLDYLHRQRRTEGARVIHRDISPENVMVDLHGQAKITDFGVSKVLVGEDVASAHRFGKPLYAPPEQLSAQPIDPRADLYALGVTLFELLTGENPYDDPLRPNENPWAKVSRAARTLREPIAKHPAIAKLPTAVPAPMLEVLERLIQGKPEARPAAAEEIFAPLEQTITALGHDLPAVQQRTGELVSLVYGPPDTALDLGDTPLEEPPMSHSTKRPIVRAPAPEQNTLVGIHEVASGQEPDTDAAQRLEVRPGTRIGPFRVVRQIGAGGMGATYVATREDVDKRACLKLIRADLASDPDYRESFLAEAKAAAKASHPNVVSLIDFGQHESGELWAAYDLVDGADLQTLANHSPEGCLPPEHVAVVALDMAHALDHLHTPDHRRGVIIHRDVSAKNAMVSYQGHVAVIDFGISKIMAGPSTQTDVKGKMTYLAPEVLRGDPIGPAVDQWAFGVLLYRLLGGRFPYTIAYDGRPPPPLTSPLGPLDPRWVAIVARLMQPEPEHRYPTLAAMIDELAPLAPSPSARRQLGGLLRRMAPPKSVVSQDGIDIEQIRREALADLEQKREKATARAVPSQARPELAPPPRSERR